MPLTEQILETIAIIHPSGWTWHEATETSFRYQTVQSVYIKMSGEHNNLSPILDSRRWSCTDVSKYPNDTNPEQYSLNCSIVDEKLGCVFGLTINPYWGIIVPRDYPKTKHLNKRSIAEFFVKIIKKQIDCEAEIFLYSDYQEGEEGY